MKRVTQPEGRDVPYGWIVVAEVLHRIEAQPYHWPIERKTLRALVAVVELEGFNMTSQAIALRKHPTSADLDCTIGDLRECGLTSEKGSGSRLTVHVGRRFPELRGMFDASIRRQDAVIERIVDLFMRLDAHRAEIVRAVLSVARLVDEPLTTERDTLQAVMKSNRKRSAHFNLTEVALAIRNLAALGWLKVKASDDLPLPEEAFADV